MRECQTLLSHKRLERNSAILRAALFMYGEWETPKCGLAKPGRKPSAHCLAREAGTGDLGRKII